MAEFSRRDMLGAAAAGGMAAAATGTETFGQGQPSFGPTPAPLAGAELPSFRFQLGAVTPKSWDGGWAKEATVAQFPVSQALAGVLMCAAAVVAAWLGVDAERRSLEQVCPPLGADLPA